MSCTITVDQAKCIKCGICVEICPSCILDMTEAGPICTRDRGCMACGHCTAICPTGALNNNECPVEDQPAIPMPILDKNTAYNFLRMRRSIRCFKPQKVKEEEIRELLNVARYAPTAANTQGMYYLVISDEQKIRQIADLTAQWMEEEIAAGSSRSRYFTNVLRVYKEQGKDIIARNTPHLILALARRLNVTGVSNCEQSFAYAELFAPTIGLGTTIAGFIQTCAQSGYEPLRELLQIEKKKVIVGAMMVGYPKYKYKRLVERQHLKIEFME